MSDLLSIGQHLAAGALSASLPDNLRDNPGDSLTPEPSPTPLRTTTGNRSTSLSRGRRRTNLSCVSSESNPTGNPQNAIQTLLASIKAQRDAERAERLAERRARWEADSLRGQWECATCLDTGRDYLTELDCACPAGATRSRERERRRLEELRETIAVQVREVLAAARIPAEYQAWTLENFPRRARTLMTLRSWVGAWNGRDGLILFGSYGAGKTSLMISLLRVLATHYLTQDLHGVIRARFKRASELFTDLHAAMDSKDGSYDQIMTEAKQVRLFVLDDLGRENPKSEWVSETLFEILDARYAQGLPIFATTNYTPETLKDRLGVHAEAIMERLNDRCVWLKVTGTSMRKSQARVIE